MDANERSIAKEALALLAKLIDYSDYQDEKREKERSKIYSFIKTATETAEAKDSGAGIEPLPSLGIVAERK